ncbi:MAG: murein L,D-transpeptidase, partial [Xanthomonadales bacterium]|nr:murein L,D-transpeptidase [Xanthomonadales bacterium]
RAAAAAARVRPALEQALAGAGLHLGAPVFVRIFKEEGELELWLEGADGRHVLFRTWPICTWSGTLGPKLREGDGQAPEGFYRVGAAQMNPRSRFHLSFDLGYPNAYDRAHGRSGSFLMVHGACVSIGCYAMGDAAIEEIYTLVAAAQLGGQRAFDVHAFPFRPEAARLAAAKASPWHAFWSELAPAYKVFERTRRPPRIAVEHGRYVVGEG